MTNWNKISSVMASEYRVNVLKKLKSKSPRKGKDLSDKLEISMSHSSEILSSLQEMNLVKCLTPEKRRDRLFAITAEGEEVVDYLQEEGFLDDG